MAVFRKVHTSFWQDNFVLNLEPDEKYFYIYLMTNSKTSQCGIYEIPKIIMQLETGLEVKVIEELLQRFMDHEKIIYSEDTNEIMMLNWIKHNGSSSWQVLTRIISELKEIKNKELVKKYLDLSIEYGYPMHTEKKIINDYESLLKTLESDEKSPVTVNVENNGFDTVSIEHGCPIHTPKQKEEEEEEEREEEREEEVTKISKKFSSGDIEYELSKYLFEKILKNDNNAKEPNLQKWSEHIDKLIRLDNRTPEEIKQVINFATTDDFWKCNILSTSKLRKQFPRLYLQRKGDKKNKQSNKDFEERDYDYDELERKLLGWE